MKKPTGTMGSIRISPSDTSFRKIILPDSKEDIEKLLNSHDLTYFNGGITKTEHSSN